MNGLARWVESGLVVDLAIALLLIEWLLLTLYARVRQRGPQPSEVAASLLAGLCLLLALRFAMAQAAWPASALLLLGALIAHLFDLWRRWPQGPR